MSARPPIHRLPIAGRRARLDPLVGRTVRFTWKNDYYPEVALLVSVAKPLMGTASELVILRSSGFRDSAISTANLVEARELG